MSAVVRIVEDEEAICELLRLMVERAGHRVASDVSPEHLLDEGSWGTVTHAIVDLELKGWPFDGVDVLRWLQAHRPDVVRILSSGHLREDLMVIEAEATHLAHYVVAKPISPNVLKHFLEGGVPEGDA